MKKGKKIALIIGGGVVVLVLIVASLIGGILLGADSEMRTSKKINNELSYDPKDIEGVWFKKQDNDRYRPTSLVYFELQKDETFLVKTILTDDKLRGELDIDSIDWFKSGVIDSYSYNDSLRIIPFQLTPTGYEVKRYNSFYTVGKNFDWMTNSHEDYINHSFSQLYLVRLPIKDGKYYWDIEKGEDEKDYLERKTGIVINLKKDKGRG